MIGFKRCSDNDSDSERQARDGIGLSGPSAVGRKGVWVWVHGFRGP